MKYDIENLKKRLIYRSQYRGTKEMDKLISSFVKENINKIELEELLELEEFLNIDDDSLYKMYNDRKNAKKNKNLNNIIQLFLNFDYKT